MTHRLISILTFLLLGCLSCLGPDDPAEQRAARAEKATGDIVFGVVVPEPATDSMFREGIQMAVDEINGAGGILHRKIRIIKRVDDGSEGKGLAIAQEYANDPDLVAVIGDYPRFNAMKVSVLFQYYGILLLATGTTSPNLTRESFSLIFRMVPDDTVRGRELAEFCFEHGYEKILVYKQIVEAGRDLADPFITAAQRKGLTIVQSQEYNAFTTGQDLRKLLLRSVRRYPFDALLISGRFSQCMALIETAGELGIKKPIIAGGFLERAEFLKRMGAQSCDVFVPTTFKPDSENKNTRRFVEAFRSRTGKVPDAQAAQGYEAVQALAYAIKQAGNTAPPRMAHVLHSTKGFRGLAGTVSFDARGNRLGANIVIMVVKGGRFEYVPSKGNSPGKDGK